VQARELRGTCQESTREPHHGAAAHGGGEAGETAALGTLFDKTYDPDYAFE
jgi:hypothetical protein